MFKISVLCNECMDEYQKNGEIELNFSTEVDLAESSLYSVTCQNGHKKEVTLSQFKFEMLFDMGVHAINDGYYREGYSAFSASLERIYETITKILLIRDGFPYENIKKYWKPLENSSERQLGAFIGVYGNAMKDFPKVLSSDDVKDRNAVIHKGKFPSKEDTIKYGQTVLDILNSLTDLMRGNLEKATENYKNELQKELNPGKKNITIVEYPTLIYGSHDRDGPGRNTLEEILAFLELKTKLNNGLNPSP